MSRWSPRVTVACVVERDGRYLVVEEERGGPATLFNQPAGHLEPDESLLEAVRREVLEETAWRITPQAYLGLYCFRTASGLTFHSHGFIARPESRLDRALDRDILACHWLTLEEIETLERAGRLRSPLVLQRIQDAAAGRHYPLKVIHEINLPRRPHSGA
ncbi:NUDIX hydrolase [Halomonas sp. 328]|uniref:NUDIX hydrolase n=1 Tax=Halomonas sp. 328 TaxID=2776704 RepID=UPI0018A715E0|nr:NUDIX hydrolase [Halomonas sp. 328]MBF8223826.1 NUDIX hydrolase [Halomonas sp. 328]